MECAKWKIHELDRAGPSKKTKLSLAAVTLAATATDLAVAPHLLCFVSWEWKGLFAVFPFNATLLKLTIPRIKLMRNRREVQLKQMRNDVAMLLEAGQETKAVVKENMVAAQDIIQIFCELIVARLPMIQSQRECPLDLKEAICSLIELLSVQAPSLEKKLNLLTEIAIEHNLDWDPTASETKFLKKHEDLLVINVSQNCLFLKKNRVKLIFTHQANLDHLDQTKINPTLHLVKRKVNSLSFMTDSYLSRTKTKVYLDSQDVLVAAETAEVRSSKLNKKSRAHVPDSSFENPFYATLVNKSETEKEHFTEQNTAIGYDGGGINDVEHDHDISCSHSSSFPSFDTLKEDFGSSLHNQSVVLDDKSSHQLNRLPSADAYSDFLCPNFFTSQNSNIGFHNSDNRHSGHGCHKQF
ncbi:hypothetical protein VNO80_16417 [Phaseolus coccineus]|uniref:Uncharacterized protein n=1 Tax=Phaseolus coccineus TaxID=3886 RepID=A0AAN9MM34_PHACN